MAPAGSAEERTRLALETARRIADEDANCCREIGNHGLELIRRIAEERKGKPVQILTHCNAGWLAFVDHGSATAPIYAAHESGIPVHVWVDETRPRSQGSKLTAWELGHEGVPHTVVVDNAAGHLMQRGLVDLVLVGTDRTTFTGDVANKIGTYLKALAARDNKVPFYVALPSSSFDWTLRDGREIPIEERGGEEVKYAEAWQNGEMTRIALAPAESRAANYAFDVTPRQLVTGLITERGICRPEEKSILSLFPERAQP
jgi:methylthioribose-1-phosphate isomerase